MKEYYASLKKSKWFPLIIGVISVVLGIICLLNPKIKMESLAVVMAVIFLVFAVFQIAAGILEKENQKLRILHILAGAVVVVLAILIFANMALIGKYLPSLFGFFMIISAGISLFHNLVLWKNDEKNWWIGAVFAAVVLVLGFIFLLRPGLVGSVFGIYTGITLLVNGVSNLTDFILFKK